MVLLGKSKSLTSLVMVVAATIILLALSPLVFFNILEIPKGNLFTFEN